MQTQNIDILPVELVNIILNKFDGDDRILELVCKLWASIVDQLRSNAIEERYGNKDLSFHFGDQETKLTYKSLYYPTPTTLKNFRLRETLIKNHNVLSACKSFRNEELRSFANEKLASIADLKKQEYEIEMAKKIQQSHVAAEVTILPLACETLSELSPIVCMFFNVQQIILRQNRLSSLPHQLSVLKTLTSIDLSLNKFTEIPPVIFKITSLSYLSISDNDIPTIPPEITQLTNLITLDLRGNSIKELPAEIRQLTNLTQVGLRPREYGLLRKTAIGDWLEQRSQ